MNRWLVFGAFMVSLHVILLAYRNYLRDLLEAVLTLINFRCFAIYLLSVDLATLPMAAPRPFYPTPRIIHQEYRLWRDADAAAFVSAHYPKIFPHFLGYPQTIQRTNVLRYLILNTYGGIYLDLDITCLQPLDNLLSVPWLTPAAHPAGVNNAFILSKPQHQLLELLVQRIPSRDISWPLPYVENMLSTGCMFFSNAWMAYTKSNHTHPWATDKVYVLAGKNDDMESEMLRGNATTTLFHHGGASSWHSWDAHLIFWVGRHWRALLGGLGGLMALMLLGLVVYGTRERLLPLLWKRQATEKK